MKEGSTDWLRLRCRAALLRVVSEMLRDIPNPGLLDIKGSEIWDWWLGLWGTLGNSGSMGEVGVGGGLVWAPELTKPCNLGFLGGWGSLKFGIMGEFLLRRILAPENDSYFKLADSRTAENTDYALAWPWQLALLHRVLAGLWDKKINHQMRYDCCVLRVATLDYQCHLCEKLFNQDKLKSAHRNSSQSVDFNLKLRIDQFEIWIILTV